MENFVETLQTIDTLGNASAGELAKALHIKPSAFSNRAKSLLEKSLIHRTSNGKEKKYSLTQSGKLFLETHQNKSETTNSSKLTDTLTRIIEENFDDTYRLIDLFFEESFSSVIKYYMSGILKIDPRAPLILEFWHNLTDCIYTASYQNLTKYQLSDFLNATGDYSREVRGAIYYIADKYNDFLKQNEAACIKLISSR